MSEHEEVRAQLAPEEQLAPDEQPTPDRAPNADGTPRTRGRWRRRWDRVSHIYRTRVRTTTVLLVLVWVGCLILYLFSANHYGTLPTSPEPQRAPVTSEYRETVEPTTDEPQPQPSTGSESMLPSGVQPSSPTTSPESTPGGSDETDTLDSAETVAPTGAGTRSSTP